MKKTKNCLRCGKEFFLRPGKLNHLCDTCRSEPIWKSKPAPPKKGLCICWFDGLDYEISECDQRRKIARERLVAKKHYIMPQCARCTEDMPKKAELEFRCGYCYRVFEPRIASQKHCSKNCRIKHIENTRKAKAKAKAAKANQ